MSITMSKLPIFDTSKYRETIYLSSLKDQNKYDSLIERVILYNRFAKIAEDPERMKNISGLDGIDGKKLVTAFAVSYLTGGISSDDFVTNNLGDIPNIEQIRGIPLIRLMAQSIFKELDEIVYKYKHEDLPRWITEWECLDKEL